MVRFFAGAVVALMVSGIAQAQVACDSWDQSAQWRGVIFPTHWNLYLQQTQELQAVINARKDVRKVFTAANQQLLNNLKQAPGSICQKRAPFMTMDEAMEVFAAAYNHPVASLSTIRKYDPRGGIGFCFGRALTTQTIANQRGMAPDSVLKIWAVGRMVTSTITWGFHVTTIVRGPTANGQTTWYAIDPIFGRPMNLDEWVNVQMAGLNSHGEVRFYVTPSEKFGPNVGAYSSYAMDDAFYNNYFTDWKDYNQAMTRQCKSPSTDGPVLLPSACLPVESWPDHVPFAYSKPAVEALARRAAARESATRGANRPLSYSNVWIPAHKDDRRAYSDLFREIMGWKKPELIPTR